MAQHEAVQWVQCLVMVAVVGRLGCEEAGGVWLWAGTGVGVGVLVPVWASRSDCGRVGAGV